MRDTLRAVGVARHSLDEITALGERSLSALSVVLGEKPYLFGAKAAGVDATAFAVVAGILTPFFESPLRRKALGHANLVAYTGRMMKEFYPEHPGRWWEERCREPRSHNGASRSVDLTAGRSRG